MENQIITEEDYSMLKYFWEEKGNMKRYCEYERLEPTLRKQHPELFKAIKAHKKALKRLDKIISSLSNIE